MLKTKFKFIVILLGFLTVWCLFNTSTVNAMTHEEVQKALDLIPNEFNLDIPKIEYKKAKEIITENIKQIWEDNGINNVDDYIIYIANDIFYENGALTKPEISVSSKENSDTSFVKSKKIEINYNNTNKGNNEDEQYIKNLQIEKILYHKLPLDLMNTDKNDIISKDYAKQINDNSITIISAYGEGGSDGGINFYGGIHLGLFKNGKLYDVRRMGSEVVIPIINVPSNIKDENLNEYIIQQITKYYPTYGQNISKIEKGANYSGIDIENGYTIYSTYGTNEKCYVVIEREKDTSLQIKDETTNIRVETNTTVLPVNTKLVVNELKEGKSYETATEVLSDLADKMYVYDITLQSEGVEVQPNGKVKVSIPVPNDLDINKLVVYRINDDRTKTEYAVTVENGYATFETDHFSTYVLAEEKTAQGITGEINNETTNETIAEGEKDETPKTGIDTKLNINNIGLITLVAIITKRFIK